MSKYPNTEWQKRTGLTVFEIQYLLRCNHDRVVDWWESGELMPMLENALQEGLSHPADELKDQLKRLREHMKNENARI